MAWIFIWRRIDLVVTVRRANENGRKATKNRYGEGVVEESRRESDIEC